MWGTARERLAERVRQAGFEIENAHWDWRSKVRHRPDWHCLVAVEYEDAVQGLMAVENRLRLSRIAPDRWLVYVDFLEVAPWNRREPPDRGLPAVQHPLFNRVGRLLMAEAVRMSLGPTANGRVGLHSLPGVEGFYAACGMASLGPDPDYYDLVYFEYPEGVAIPSLVTAGVSV